MRESVLLGMISFLIILAIIIPQILYPSGLSPDTYERVRVANIIASTGHIPTHTNVFVGGPVPYVYPPLPDIILGVSTQYLPIPISKLILNTILAIISAFSLFLIAKSLKLDKIQATMAVLFLFSNLAIIKRYSSLVAETWGLTLFLICTYTLVKYRSKVLSPVLLSAIAVTHFRTILNVTPIYIALKAYNKEIRILSLELFIVAMLIAPWYLYNLNNMHGLSGYAIEHHHMKPHFIETIGLVLLVLSVIGVWKGRKTIPKAAYIWLGTILSITIAIQIFYPTALPHREVRFTIPVLSIFAAKVFDTNMLKKAGMIIAIALLVYSTYTVITTWHSYFSEGDVAGVIWVHKEFKGAGVLCDHGLGYLAAYYGLKVIAGPFMESVPFATTRVTDVYRAHKGYEEAYYIMKKYRVRIFINRNHGVPGKELILKANKIYNDKEVHVYVIPKK